MTAGVASRPPACKHVFNRWFVRAVGFLLLGAVVNVAVAWGCACRAPSGRATPVKTPMWPGSVPDDWPDEPAYSRTLRSTGFYISLHSHTDTRNWPQLLYRYRYFESGLPLRSMQWESVGEIDRDTIYGFRLLGPPPELPATGLDPPDWMLQSDRWTAARRLPMNPIWPGFALNTLFYTMTLWLLFAAPFALRRWRRIRNGLCTTCAYPMGESDICTECGHALR